MALTRKEGGFFLGESSLKSLSWGLTMAVIAVFWAEMWPLVVWTDRMTAPFPHINAVFFFPLHIRFSSCYLLLYYFVWSCNFALWFEVWDISLSFDEWRICFNCQTKFFLTQIEGLRREDVVQCTECKAHWGNVIVILGYMNKNDLIGLWSLSDLHTPVPHAASISICTDTSHLCCG